MRLLAVVAITIAPALAQAASDACLLRCADVPAAARPTARAGCLSSPGGGVFVSYDPVERQLVPPSARETSAVSAALRQALERSHAGLVEVRRPDGSAHVYLGGRFMAGIAVRVGPGGPVTTCVTTLEAAQRFLHEHAPVPVAEVE